MKILLTGGNGMVGRNILEHADSYNYSILSPSSTELDLLNKKNIDSYLNQENPDLIIHAAGRVGGIQANINDPISFLYDNALMGLNLVNASYCKGINNFINLGSSCMYPLNAKNPLKESSLLTGPFEPTNEGYAISKCIVAKFCEYITKSYPQKNFKTVIPCNLYGRFDSFEENKSHLIPAIISKIHIAMENEQNEVEIWGDGMVKREFMYAGDFADFIFFSIKNIQKLPQYLNVGLGKDYSVLDYYNEVAKVINFKGRFSFNLNKPSGIKQKLVDISCLNKLEWKHKTNLSDGIRNSYNYYLDYIKNEI